MNTEPLRPYQAREAKQQNAFLRGLSWGLLTTVATGALVHALNRGRDDAGILSFLNRHTEALVPAMLTGVAAYQAATHHNANAELIQKLELAEKRGELGEALKSRPEPDFLPFKQNHSHLFGGMLSRGLVVGSVGFTWEALTNKPEDRFERATRWGAASAVLGAASELTHHLIHEGQHNRRAEILEQFQHRAGGFAARVSEPAAEGAARGA